MINVTESKDSIDDEVVIMDTNDSNKGRNSEKKLRRENSISGHQASSSNFLPIMSVISLNNSNKKLT